MSRALAGLALSWDWFLEAAAILVGFDGMLRVMELLKIQPRHVSGNLQGASMVPELPDTKTPGQKSTIEKAVLTCPFSCILLSY